MLSLTKFLIFFLLIVNSSASEPIESLCSDILMEESKCVINQPDLNLSNTFSINTFRKWEWLKNRAKRKSKLLQAEIDNNKGMLRFLRDDFVDESESTLWYENEFKAIKRDFETLGTITSEIQRVSNRLNMCFKVCSPAMQVENEEHLRKLQKLKMILLSKRPILAGPQIEEIIAEKNINDERLKSSLVNAYSDYLSFSKDEISALRDEFGKEDSQYNFAKESRDKLRPARLKEFFHMLEGETHLNKKRSELLSGIDWRDTIENEEDPDLACYFYNKNKEYKKSENIKDLSVEAAMFVAPFVVGPAFRLGVWGLKGAKILKWGMREDLYMNITKATTGLSSSAFFLKDTVSISKRRKECEKKYSEFLQSSKKVNYQKYIECNEDLSFDTLVLAAESSLVGFSSLKSISKAIRINKGFREESTLFHVKDMDELAFYIENKKIETQEFGDAGFKLSLDKGDYYVLNLNGPKSEVSTLSGNYWQFVSKTYKKRLNLSDAEVESFIKSSKEMEDRTTLLLSTKKGEVNTFRGGLAFVDSKDLSEPLPFEKATGISVDRPEGKKIGEVVRLTVDDKIGGRKLSDELTNQLTLYLKSQNKLDKAYIYTSKSHFRLYKRTLKKVGIKYKLINDLDRDVILEIEP